MVKLTRRVGVYTKVAAILPDKTSFVEG